MQPWAQESFDERPSSGDWNADRGFINLGQKESAIPPCPEPQLDNNTRQQALQLLLSPFPFLPKQLSYQVTTATVICIPLTWFLGQLDLTEIQNMFKPVYSSFPLKQAKKQPTP